MIPPARPDERPPEAANASRPRAIGTGSHLFWWRLRSVLTFAAQHLFPVKRWARYVIPGKLVVATTSPAAAHAIEQSLETQQVRRVFRVQNATRISRMTDDPDHPDLLDAWDVNVARGCEQAVLRELEWRVTRELEREGDYEGLHPRLSLKLTRLVMSAHQCRRIIFTAAVVPGPQSEVKLTHHHDLYRQMIARDSTQHGPVSVAVIDSFCDLDLIPSEHRNDVSIEDYDDLFEMSHNPHAAVTTTLIKSLAPEARVRIYPVTPKDQPAPETMLIYALNHVARDKTVQVIAMCLALNFPRNRPHPIVTDQVERALSGLGGRPIIIVSSGNRSTKRQSELVRFPATCSSVVMVGAVDSERRRPFFSCYLLEDKEPAGRFVAPGGDGIGRDAREFPATVGIEVQTGTSVAAAYAAGIAARTICALPPGRELDAKALCALLDAAADREFERYSEDEYGRGLIREPQPTIEPLRSEK